MMDDQSNPKLHIPRSQAEIGAIMASMTSTQLEQVLETLGNLSDTELTQLLQMMGASQHLGGVPTSMLYPVFQRFRGMSAEERHQFVEQVKAVSQQQTHTSKEKINKENVVVSAQNSEGGNSFKDAPRPFVLQESIPPNNNKHSQASHYPTTHHHSEDAQIQQAVRYIRNMSPEQQETLIEDLIKKGQMDERQKGLIGLYLKQVQSADDDLLHNFFTIHKARRTGQPINTGLMQELQITLMQKTLSSMKEEDSNLLIEKIFEEQRIDQIGKEHKDLSRLVLQHLQSASHDQIKDMIDSTFKVQPTGEPADSRHSQELPVPPLKIAFDIMREPEKAIEGYTQELAGLSHEQQPFRWARTHYFRGTAYCACPDEENGMNLERALEDFNAALTVLTPDNAADEWRMLMRLRSALYRERKVGHFVENYQKAVADSETVLAVLSQQESPEEWAMAKLTRAMAYAALAGITGDKSALSEKAILDCDYALSVFSYQNQPEDWLNALITRCSAHCGCESGNVQQHKELAIADADTGLKVITKEEYPEDWARLHSIRAVAYLQRAAGNLQDNLDQAMADCEAALTVYTHEDYPRQRAGVLHDCAIIRTVLGHGDMREYSEQGIEDRLNAVSSLQKETHPFEWARTHLDCAVLYIKRLADNPSKNLSLAYEHCNMALDVFNKEQTPIYWGRTLLWRGLARLYSQLPREVHQLVENRVGLTELAARGQEYAPQLLQSYYNVVIACLDDFSTALTVVTKENSPTEWAQAHMLRANISTIINIIRADGHFFQISEENTILSQASEDYRMAQTVFTPASRPFEWASMQATQAVTLILLAKDSTTNMVAMRQHAQEAIKLINSALVIFTTEVAPAHYQLAQSIRAIAYEYLHGWEEAHKSWLETRKVRRTVMATALIEQSRTDQTMLMANINIYKHDAQVLLCCTPPDVTEAVIALEEGRAQGLRLAFDLDSLDPQKIENPQAKRRAETLLTARENWQQCQQKVEQLENIIEYSERRHQYIQDLQRAHEAFIQAGNAIRQYDDPDFTSLVPTLTSIARAISEQGEALVYLVPGLYSGSSMIASDYEFSTDADRGIAIIVMRDSQGEPLVHSLALPLLTGFAIDDLYKGKQASGCDNKQAIQQASELGLNELVKTLQQFGVYRITIVPYGPLSLFPLAAIQVQGSNGKTSYLGDLFEISVAPSARSYEISRLRASEAARNQRRQGLCLVGNPFPLVDDIAELPLAEAEADTLRQIARAYGYSSARIRHVSRSEATKQQVVEGLKMAQYAHLALHGIYNVVKPLDSRLLLAGNRSVPEQERSLTLGEIMKGAISLSGLRLLVLSACDTSLIDLRRLPDEVVGLVAGFLQAGVAGVIASLWRVDDTATYLLMVRFARHYLDPQGIWSPARALTDAQRWLRQEATNRVLSTYDPLEDLLIPSQMPEESQMLYNKTILKIRRQAKKQLEIAPDVCPYADPKYWAAFMVTGC